jgi:hypothetical protein
MLFWTWCKGKNIAMTLIFEEESLLVVHKQLLHTQDTDRFILFTARAILDTLDHLNLLRTARSSIHLKVAKEDNTMHGYYVEGVDLI